MISVFCFAVGLLWVFFMTAMMIEASRKKKLFSDKGSFSTGKAVGHFLIVVIWFIASLVSYLIKLP